MIAAWMLYALVTGAMLAAAALVVEWACRARRWPTRWAWGAALALTVVLTLVAPVRVTVPRTLESLTIGRVEAPVAMPARDVSLVGRAATMLGSALATVRDVAARPYAAAMRTLAAGRAATIDGWLLALWAVASLACLTTAAVVAHRIRRARDAWPELGLHGQRVRVAPAFGPAVVGVRDARIVVPRWLLACAAPAQRMVVAHEREHLHAGDPRLLALGGIAVILMPWHPVAWWMLARLRLAVELDCDRRVLARGVAPADYGALLLDVAGRGAGLPLGFAALGVPTMATRTHHLERRLVAMTTPRLRHARTRIALAAAVTLATVLAACESRLPTSAELERMDVAGAERRLAIVNDTVATRYFVNDILVSAAEAHATTAGEIVSISLSRSPDSSAGRDMRIATKQRVALMRVPGPDTITVDSLAKLPSREPLRFEGIVFIDGVRSSERALGGIAPASIASIDVYKGATAQQLYPNEPDAAKGVIKVTTKKAR